MKKALVLSLICFMALGARLAMADTRTDALGLTAGNQVDDLDSIWLFPQDAGNYGNVVDLRLGNPNGAHIDWGGILHKDFDEIGFIGIYVNRPFNQSNGIAPNTNFVTQNGILNGTLTWANALNPGNISYWGTATGDSDNQVTATYNYINSTFINGPTFANNVGMADPNNKADLFWSKDFSDVTLGAHLNYANQTGNDPTQGGATGDGTGSYVQGTPTLNGQINSKYNSDSSVLGLDLGATLKNLGSNMSLALGLGYSLGSLNLLADYTQNYMSTGTQTSYLNDSLKDNNISELRVNALLKNKMNDTTMGRIYLNAHLDNLGVKLLNQQDTSGDGTFGDAANEIVASSSTFTDTLVNLGVACDHTVADGKALVVAGIGIIYDGMKWTQTRVSNTAGSTSPDQVANGSGSTYTEDWLVVPFNVAIEAPIFDWLTSRIGFSKNLYNNINDKVVQPQVLNGAGTAFTDTATANNSFDQDSNINLTYGASAKMGNFTLDMQVNPNTLLTYARGFAPGQGVLYGNTGNTAQAVGASSTSGLFATIIQADLRYAF